MHVYLLLNKVFFYVFAVTERQISTESASSRNVRKPSSKTSGRQNAAKDNPSFDRSEPSSKAVRPSLPPKTSTSDAVLVDIASSSSMSLSSSNYSSQSNPLELLQSSVAEKYAHLPVPVIEDPTYSRTKDAKDNFVKQPVTAAGAYLPKRPPLVNPVSVVVTSSMSLVSASSLTASSSITSTSVTSSSHSNLTQPYYSCPPVETYNTANCNAAVIVADKEKAYKSFDWLTDEVVGLKQNEGDSCRTEKVPMVALAKEDNVSKILGSEKRQSPLNSAASARLAADSSVNNIATSGESLCSTSDERTESPIPVLPPKDYLKKGESHHRPPYEYKSRILPVIQDGQQVSKTHYFLLPLPGEKKAAQVKPYKPTSDYVNTNPPAKAKLPAKISQQDSLRPKSISDVGYLGTHAYTNAGVSKSMLSLTSQQTVDAMSIVTDTTSLDYVDHDDSLLSEDWSDDESVSSLSLSMSSVREKIDVLKSRVIGVTEEQCQAALQSHSWDVDIATRYLKIEQMFRMGIATRDKCQRLLESFDWNLEMASSVLLDQFANGSAV